MEEGVLETDHNVPLEDLESGTMYYYRVRGSTEVDGPVQYSEVHSFQTPSAVDPTEGKTNYALLENGTSIIEVSSNYFGAANDETWGIDSAFDGSMSSEWSSDLDGDDAFVELDFGQMRTITTFGFRSRKMFDGTSITLKLQLEVGDQIIGPFATDNPDQRYLFDLDEPVQTRTIRVQYLETTGGNTGAKEIQFYGAD
jgi:hypothetical protein